MTTVIRELVADDFDAYCQFLTEHFFNHVPSLQSPGFSPVITNSREMSEKDLEIIKQGLSLVAVDPNNNNRIVGLALAEEWDSSDVEKIWIKVNEKKPTELIEHVEYFMADLERRAQVFDRYNVSKLIYWDILTIDSSMRCQGLGRRLAVALIHMGRSKGFPLISCCCTSLYSTRLMLSLGMDCVLSEAYANYKDEDGNAILRPPQPHTDVSIMAMRL